MPTNFRKPASARGLVRFAAVSSTAVFTLSTVTMGPAIAAPAYTAPIQQIDPTTIVPPTPLHLVHHKKTAHKKARHPKAVERRVAAPVTVTRTAPVRSTATISRSAEREPVRAQDGRVGAAYAVAMRQIGDPYRYGASGPDAFDCSGLVSYALGQAGFHGVPRTAAGQVSLTRPVDRGSMRVGDLIFFGSGGGVYHVGFFAGWDHGNPLILHAPRTGEAVQIERVWATSWFAGRLV